MYGKLALFIFAAWAGQEVSSLGGVHLTTCKDARCQGAWSKAITAMRAVWHVPPDNYCAKNGAKVGVHHHYPRGSSVARYLKI
jgi:hypothetical protein